MSGCCEIAAAVSARQRRVLRIVLAVNLAMFVGEATAGVIARPSSPTRRCWRCSGPAAATT